MIGRELIEHILVNKLSSLEVVVEADHGQDPTKDVDIEVGLWNYNTLIHPDDVEEGDGTEKVIVIYGN